jgi:hypothetical protein
MKRTIFLIGLLALHVAGMPASAAAPSASLTLSPSPSAATFPTSRVDPEAHEAALAAATSEVRRVAHWVIVSRDSGGLPFLLIDKVSARVFAFDAAGQLQGSAPALLGLAKGDRMLAPNDATMAQMPPSVRITPAGRFVSRLGIDSEGKQLLILDYAASLSLHPVVKGTPEERRAERLGSATVEDNRISFGCINVPPEFFTTIVSPAFNHTRGVVYVLPETSAASAVFGFDPVGAAAPPAPAMHGPNPKRSYLAP